MPAKMNSLTDNCDKFTLRYGGYGGSVLLGESGIVVSLSSWLTSKSHSGSLTIEFEDENGEKVDFHTWCACRPLWPLEYGLNNAKVWLFVSRADEFRSPWDPSKLIRIPKVNETVVFHQLRLRVATSSSEGEMHDVFIKVYAEQTYARAQYARSQRNELFVLRALVSRRRAKATSRTAPWLKWLLGAGSLALPDELARQVFGFWRPTE